MEMGKKATVKNQGTKTANKTSSKSVDFGGQLNQSCVYRMIQKMHCCAMVYFDVI